MNDLEARVKKLEEKGNGCLAGCLPFAIVMIVDICLAFWADRWQRGETDLRPPFWVERISYTDWQARHAEGRP